MNRDLWRKADWLFVFLVLLLSGIGFALTFTSSIGLAGNLSLKTGIYVSVGIMAMFFLATIDYNKYKEIERPIYLAMTLLLVLVLLFGTEVYGAKNWIFIGPFSIQPSEFAKIFFVLALGSHLSNTFEHDNGWKPIAKTMGLAAVPLLLILMEPDMGTALVYISITFGMMYASPLNKKYISILLFGALSLIVGWIALHLSIGLPIPLSEYQVQRFTVFLDPYGDGQNGLGAGYNIIQAIIAVGSGGFFGKGFQNGTQVNLLPVKESDFIFSVIGEEFGFVGSLFLLFLLFGFLAKALVIAHECLDQYGFVVVMGFISMFLFHIIENVGMNLSLMPITGIPLPFISAAGSNLLANFLASGIILNISMQRTKIIF